MGKTGRWIKSFLTGKKEKKNNDNENTSTTEHPTTPISTTPKEKKRWSFRRSSATVPHKDLSATDITLPVAAAAAAEAVIQLTASARTDEAAAAVKIQAVFRGYLSRKALNALKGLVKLQALVRGHLVRKQAAATLKCMQALVTAQARARAQRITMTQQGNPRQSVHRKSTHTYQDYEEEDIKIVEMDRGDQSTKNRNSYSNRGQSPKHISPAPSAVADQSPRAYSGHFEEYNAYGTAQSSPQYYSSAISKPRSEYAESLYNEYVLYPSYMANTESSRAKVRSHSAPKQRPDQSSFERQPSSRRRPSIEGRNVPRAVRMQRSSSHVGSTAQNYNYPWSIKLDRSNISIKDSECGSNSSLLTAHTNYCTSLVGFHVQGKGY